MLNAMLEAVTRRRRPVLVGVLVGTVLLRTAAETSDDGLRSGLYLANLLVMSALFLLALLATARYHPAVLDAPPGRSFFTAPAEPARVLTAAAITVLVVSQVTSDVGDLVRGDPLWTASVVISGVMVLGAAVHWHVVWSRHPDGIRIQRDGVLDRRPLGSLFVPWDALARDFPAVATHTGLLNLYVERPELVRRRGLHRNRLTVRTVTDATYLARVIRYYVTHPERRAAIGTQAEHRRLSRQAGGSGQVDAPQWDDLAAFDG